MEKVDFLEFLSKPTEHQLEEKQRNTETPVGLYLSTGLLVDQSVRIKVKTRLKQEHYWDYDAGNSPVCSANSCEYYKTSFQAASFIIRSTFRHRVVVLEAGLGHIFKVLESTTFVLSQTEP